MNNPVTILAISGSLRKTSSNTVLVNAIKRLLPPAVNYIVYEDLGNLPHFNDADEIPAIVVEWRTRVATADAVLICTPEYAFGVPGSLKNALDWTVGATAFSGKPVALITASSSGEKAHTALQYTLQALGTRLVDSLLISFVRSKLTSSGEITDQFTTNAIQALIEKLVLAATNE